MIIFSNRQIISTWEIFNSFVKPSEGNYFRPFDHIIGCLATQIEIKNRFQIYTMELLDYTDSGQHFPKREYLPNWPNHAWPIIIFFLNCLIQISINAKLYQLIWATQQ